MPSTAHGTRGGVRPEDTSLQLSRRDTSLGVIDRPTAAMLQATRRPHVNVQAALPNRRNIGRLTAGPQFLRRILLKAVWACRPGGVRSTTCRWQRLVCWAEVAHRQDRKAQRDACDCQERNSCAASPGASSLRDHVPARTLPWCHTALVTSA